MWIINQDYVYINFFFYSYSHTKMFRQPCTEVPKKKNDLCRILQKSAEELEISLSVCLFLITKQPRPL